MSHFRSVLFERTITPFVVISDYTFCSAERAVEGPAAASLQITMPTTGIEEYSKDSLDVSKSHSNTLSVKRYDENGCKSFVCYRIDLLLKIFIYSNNIMSNSEESDFSSLDKSKLFVIVCA